MRITKKQLRRIIKEEKAKLLKEAPMTRTPPTYAEAKAELEEFGEPIWDDDLASWPELSSIFAALRQGTVPPEATDPNSLFRRAWRMAADYESESNSRNYSWAAMEEWFDDGVLDT